MLRIFFFLSFLAVGPSGSHSAPPQTFIHSSWLCEVYLWTRAQPEHGPWWTPRGDACDRVGVFMSVCARVSQANREYADVIVLTAEREIRSRQL